MKRKRIITLLVITLIIVSIVLLLVRNKKALDSRNVVVDRSNIPVAVMLYSVRQLPIDQSFEIPATLAAQDEATIAAKTAGRLEELPIKLGSRVSKGQIIGRIDVRETRLKLQSTELSIEHLKREYERNKVLVEGNATNAKALQDSEYDYKNKVIEAEQLREQIANANIVVPVAGTISEKAKEQGEFVSTSETIARVVNTTSLKARIYVPENRVFRLRIGDKAVITTEIYPANNFSGTVTFISPQGDDNHNYLVEVKIENNLAMPLRAGMYALIRFSNGNQQTALQVPKTALVNGLKDPLVYTVENNKASEKKLVLGSEVGDYVEVISGLSEGEQVVVSGQINLVDGSPVKKIDAK